MIVSTTHVGILQEVGHPSYWKKRSRDAEMEQVAVTTSQNETFKTCHKACALDPAYAHSLQPPIRKAYQKHARRRQTCQNTDKVQGNTKDNKTVAKAQRKEEAEKGRRQEAREDTGDSQQNADQPARNARRGARNARKART